MPVNYVSQSNRQMENRVHLRRAWFVIATFVMLWLLSCQPSGTTFVPLSPEVELAPAVTSVPAAIATDRGTATEQVGPLAIAPLMQDEVGCFDLLELEIEIETNIAMVNLFDPNELDIRVEFTSTSGKIVEVGAFWYQEFDATGRRCVGEPDWKVRFAPTEPGAWTA
jgi:hypothetical protein